MKRVAVDLGSKALVLCDVALTPAEQVAGLQVRPSLPLGEGMLFSFDPPRATNFHMGSVAYPIDLVFVDGQHRIGRIVANAEVGTRERWQFSPCAAVVELPGGCAERWSLAVGDTITWPAKRQADTVYNLLQGLTDGDDTELHPERFEDRGIPADTDPNNQDNDDALPGWKQTHGYDQTDPAYATGEGPALRMGVQGQTEHEAPGHLHLADIILAIIDELELHGIDWHKDPLTQGKVAHATISGKDLARWLSDMPEGVRETMTSDAGLRVLGDGLLLAGLADTTQVSKGNLILWRGAPIR